MPPAFRKDNPPQDRLPGVLASDPGILLVTALIIVSVYILDAVTPLGEPVWLLYFIPLVLSFWSGRRYAIPTVFTVTVLFLFAGLYLSPQGISWDLAIINRALFFLAFSAVALALWWIRGRQTRRVNS